MSPGPGSHREHLFRNEILRVEDEERVKPRVNTVLSSSSPDRPGVEGSGWMDPQDHPHL